MAKNTAQVNISILPSAYSISEPVSNVVFVIGKTLRGPDNNPSEIINSVSQFSRIFGAEDPTNDFPSLCMQALAAGAALRVCRVVGNAADNSESGLFATSTPANLFKFVSKERGAYTNDIEAVVSDASSGIAGEFNLTITDTETLETEVYQNLKVTGGGTAAPYSYLKPVTDYSRMVSPVYSDLSSLGATLRPVNATKTFTGGVDAAPVLANYAGVAADKTGVYAFDSFTDAYILAAPGLDDTALSGLAAVGSAYATLRGDLVYLQHLDNGHTTRATIVSEITGLGLSSKYMGFIGGGGKFVNKTAGGTKNMHSLGELLGVIAKSHARNGVWVSPTNLVNGKLPTAVGVVNNFGSPASLADLNLIANVGGNMVINRGGVNMLWDFYSQSVGESPEKFLTVVLLQIYLKRTLQPYLESFLTKPNKPSTWSDIYYGVRSFLDNLVGAAIDSWKWDGDQFATSLDQLQVNDPVLVGQGKYKAVLTVVLIVPMVEFSLDISMTTSQSVVIS